MPVPYAVAKFNKRVTDRFIQPLVSRLPGFAVVCHTGRVSGQPYRTPVYAFSSDRDLFVVLTYGTRADWYLNLQASGGLIETSTGTRIVRQIDVVGLADARHAVAWFVRIVLGSLTVRTVARIGSDPERSETGGHRPPKPGARTSGLR